MKVLTALLIPALVVTAVLCAETMTTDWAITADYAESCSCGVPCPCAFGGAPTLGHCEGGNLIEMKEAHYGEVNLDGVTVMAAFSLGKWVKLYVNEGATDEQMDAAVALVKLEPTFGMLFTGEPEIVSIERAVIEVERTPTTVKYSVPGSTVEIEMVKGLNDKPIQIANLGMPFLRNHTQYQSVILNHTGDDREFNYAKTNGLTSRLVANSTD